MFVVEKAYGRGNERQTLPICFVSGSNTQQENEPNKNYLGPLLINGTTTYLFQLSSSCGILC